MATLYEIWRLALPPTTSLRAGEANTLAVRAVVLARPTQPALPDLAGSEVVLVSTTVLDSLRLSLARLIERLNGTSVLAVGLTGMVDERAVAAAETANITLFELPHNADLRMVQRESERLLSDPEAQYERRAAQLYSALTTNGLSEGRTTLLRMLELWTGHSVVFPADAGMPTTVPVLLDGHRVGFLGSIGSHPWDAGALEQGSAALSLLLDKERAIEATEDRLRGSVLESLLAGIPLDVPGQRRAAEQGILLDSAYALAALRPQDSLQIDRMMAAVRRACDRLRYPAFIADHDGIIVLAMPIDSLDNPEQRLREVHSALHEASWVLDGGFGIASENGAWSGAWAEAIGALRLGRELLGAGVLAGGAELGVYRLLLSVADSARARMFYDRTIGPLAAHDAKQDGDLLYTLQMFFAYLGNHSQAAAALHIHRNTLLYRLGRIENITSHHLDRAPDRLALQLGLALHRIYQSQKPDLKKA